MISWRELSQLNRLCLKKLISKGYFALNVLNSRNDAFYYTDLDRMNKPRGFDEASFNKGITSGNGHENWALQHLLPHIIRDHLSENEAPWLILMDLRAIVELNVSHSWMKHLNVFLNIKVMEELKTFL